MTTVHTVPAVTAALIAQGTVTVITAAERGIDGRVLIRASERCPHRFPLPWWMGKDQDDPCQCTLDLGHQGEHDCDHGHGPPPPENPGCIVASATVEWVPIWLLDYITDQLPYGDFTAGRWAAILTDVKATTDRCPTYEIERLRTAGDRLAAFVGHRQECPTSWDESPEFTCLCGHREALAAWREVRGER